MAMTHLNEDTLRTYLDGELNDSEQAGAAAHLSGCPACRSRLESVSARSAHVARRLSALAPTPLDAPPAGRLALVKLKDKQRKESIPMFQKLFSPRFRPAWITLAVVAALAFALTLPPVQAWATNFLGLFRVQQIEVIEIDTTRINQLNGDSNLGQAMAELFSDSVTVTKESGAPVAAASSAEAGQMAGFAVRLPDNGQSPTLTVQSGTAFEFMVDRTRTQALLDEAGFGDTQLPASLDSAPIQVEIPASVTAAYGTCPDASAPEQEAERMSWKKVRGCILLVQIPSPSVNAPPDLDIDQLAAVGLQFMGMTSEEAAKVSESVDWSTTLVIPIPREAAKVEEVAVDGVTGTLIVRTTDDDGPPHYALMWVKDGIIYAVSGFDSADSALEMANSMK
jgi:hypothetical protein